MKPSVTTSICLLFFLSVFYHKSWSQSTVNAGVNIGAGSKGFFLNGKRGFGGSIEYVRKLTKQGGIRIYTGYDWFDHRTPANIDPRVWKDSMAHYPVSLQDISFLPLRMGYQRFLFGEAAFVYAEAGIANLATPYHITTNNVFSYALGTGYRFHLKEKQYVQLSFFYNYNRMKLPVNRNYVSFRAAYGLRFQKRK